MTNKERNDGTYSEQTAIHFPGKDCRQFAVQHWQLGLGWDPVKAGFLGEVMGEQQQKLDASCILLNSDLQVIDLVWFRQLEILRMDRSSTPVTTVPVMVMVTTKPFTWTCNLPASVKYLVFTVNSFTGQNFEKGRKRLLPNCKCRQKQLAGSIQPFGEGAAIPES